MANNQNNSLKEAKKKKSEKSVYKKINRQVEDAYEQELLAAEWTQNEFVTTVDHGRKLYYRILCAAQQLVVEHNTDSLEDEVKAVLNRQAKQWAINEYGCHDWAPSNAQLNAFYRKFRLGVNLVAEVHGFRTPWQSGFTVYKSPYSPVEMDIPIYEPFLKRLSDPDFVLAWLWGHYSGQYKGRQCIYCYSDGESGKSYTFSTIIEELFGLNCGAASFMVKNRAIDSQFVHQRTYGKSILYVGECHNPAWPLSDVYKEVASGETVSIEYKGKTPFTARVKAGILSLSNLPPKLTKSTAILSRTVPVVVEPFNEGELLADPKKQLIEELPGLLWRAKKAWERLNEDSYRIRYSDTTQQLVDDLVNESSQEWTDFIDDHLEFAPNGYVKASDLEHVFRKRFAGQNRINQYKEFAKYLADLEEVTKNKRSSNVYEGVHFNPEVLTRYGVSNHWLKRKLTVVKNNIVTLLDNETIEGEGKVSA